MSQQTIQIAISTCPNDTFAFHGLLTGQVASVGIDFDFQLLDIQQLNDGLFTGQFDVAKASFHAAALLTDQMVVLPSGAALGFGVGPVLLASPSARPIDAPQTVVLCPGEHTTATLLFRLFYGTQPKVQQVVFSEIMPRLQQGTADYGVCIHEGRFTWQDLGLRFVADLGDHWEQETETPIPLGGLLARRQLGHQTIRQIQSAIRESILYGLANRQETLETMRRYAQEFDDDVLFQHVDLYVNDLTVDLGEVGEVALQTLSRKAIQCGLVSPAAPAIEVWRD